MITCTRTNSTDPAFQKLVHELDAYLAVINGNENEFFSQFNKIDTIQHVVVASNDGISVGCGAIKEYDKDTMEVKRMFVNPEVRGRGIASQVLKELETWAAELDYSKCVLETGSVLTDAIRLYSNSGYHKIANYGQYADVADSVCFEKVLY
jgi:putative acetyltransferase